MAEHREREVMREMIDMLWLISRGRCQVEHDWTSTTISHEHMTLVYTLGCVEDPTRHFEIDFNGG